MRALHTAATGMMAQELNVQVISNNIANMRTTGYKRQRAEFPPRIMTQGNLLPTDKPLDVAIRGEGFFKISLPDGRTAYTRDGSFELDAQGRMVTANGYVLQPGLTIAQDAKNLTVNSQGTVSVTLPGQTTSTTVGQIELAQFVNKSGLQAIGDNLFLETPASGTPQNGTPSSDGLGDLQQGNLEQANVEAVKEISDLIAAQRAYEMNAKVITATDQMLQSTSQMLR
jgi:flagellar basal-body rod protein FlgG